MTPEDVYAAQFGDAVFSFFVHLVVVAVFFGLLCGIFSRLGCANHLLEIQNWLLTRQLSEHEIASEAVVDAGEVEPPLLTMAAAAVPTFRMLR